MNAPAALPPGVRVIVRDWLNANHVLLEGRDSTVLIDSGYGKHASVTLDLVAASLAGRKLDWLVNTHCHSDHMGGNAAIRRGHRCRLSIPVGEAPAIEAWDEKALWLAYADQRCERFVFDDALSPGEHLRWADLDWRAIAAPGHDMGALMFFCEETGVLISGDALWENGFGIVMPGPGKDERLAATRATLEEIARLEVRTVIPGHGQPFTGAGHALERSFQRLAAFERDELRMVRHVLKVMLVYALLERGRLPLDTLPAYLRSVPLYAEFNDSFLRLEDRELAEWLTRELEHSHAVRRADGYLTPASV